MNDRPSALELIRIANETLTRTVLPDAKPEQQYALRMIANALGIAARELEAHARNADDEILGLNTLYAALDKPIKNIHDLPVRNRKFALDIRYGKFENNVDQAARLRQHLLATARAKLTSAYPKGLQNATAQRK